MHLVFELRYNPETTNTDELIAWLSSGGFESFEEIGRDRLWEETNGLSGRSEQEIPLALREEEQHSPDRPRGLDAYIEAENKSKAIVFLAELGQQYRFEYSVRELKEENWNAVWEANFKPIQVGEWLGIRAAFHPPIEGVEIELLIDPKMAFGTGHHATTHMVCELMKEQDWSNKSVFDYGCGTGILAVLAKRFGAGFCWAVDIELASYENTLENAAINEVELEKVTHGTLEDIPAQPLYDYILANINRNVILASLPALYERLLPNGKLFVSGILEQDAALVLDAAAQAGFEPLQQRQREDWMAWVFQAATTSD